MKQYENDFPKEKLLSLDDRTLANLIFEINALAGGSTAKAEKLANNLPDLKKKLSKMDSKDFNRIMSSLSKEDSQKARDILDKLK